MDDHVKILKENNTAQNVPSPAGTGANELRMRCPSAEYDIMAQTSQGTASFRQRARPEASPIMGPLRIEYDSSERSYDLMNGISTLDGLYVALAFVVPGFVFSAVRNQFSTGQERQGSEQIFRFVTYSAFNYAIFSGIIYLVLANYESPFVRAALWFFVILIGPAALGIISGASIQKDWARKIFHWFKLHPVHVVPSAWDYKFGRMEGEWVLITLKNDVKFAGFCGVSSFASTDRTERDVYIEQVYDVDADNKWTPTQKRLLICSGEIRTIEFWPATNRNENVEK